MATPIRRVIQSGDSSLKITANESRRSVLHQNTMESAARILTEREAGTYTGAAIDDLQFARNDRAKVVLNPEQLEGVRILTCEQFGVIGGYAGSGKSTLLDGAIARMTQQVRKIDLGGARTAGGFPDGKMRPAIAFVAATNIAARNMATKLPEEWAAHCMSIHSLLCYAPVDKGGDYDAVSGRNAQRFEPRYHGGNSHPYDIVICDEAGNMDYDMFAEILDASEPSTRIYFLGDLAQMPPMRKASPMAFAIGYWPTVILDKIYRQKEGSALIENLTNIRRGQSPRHSPTDFRCGDVEVLDGAPSKAFNHIAAYISKLYMTKVWDPAQDIIICAENAKTLGQEAWNGAFRKAFNPPKLDDKGKVLNPSVLIQTALSVKNFRVGDKIMSTDNGTRRATEKRFVNGSIGSIISIMPNPDYKGSMVGIGEEYVAAEGEEDHGDMFSETSTGDVADIVAQVYGDDVDAELKNRSASHVITVIEQATGEIFILSRSVEIHTLQFAYAVTCSKFQGSQARNVLVICHENMAYGLNREWLYTACSRAMKRVFLLHTPSALYKSLARQQLIGRNAEEKAENLREKYRKANYALRALPKPRVL
jgi:ATP-dependent exoDNAse (exonuclease V) alpha subunit